ncbi:MAG: hypothetical protein IKB82_08135 [Clostridia bacterium]|nr:hypothetical protein [Clostridia bacterium]MBR6653234.1 hypothetical protein [Oscillospiraceae bacterium]
MELYKEILAHALSQQSVEIVFPDLHMNATQIVELECYKALQKIKAIIEDDSLDDKSCFKKIEEIVCAFEEAGSSGGGRHDFG